MKSDDIPTKADLGIRRGSYRRPEGVDRGMHCVGVLKAARAANPGVHTFSGQRAMLEALGVKPKQLGEPDGCHLPGCEVPQGPKPGNPVGMMSSSKRQTMGLPLAVVQGTLPKDIAGHVYSSGPLVSHGEPALATRGLLVRVDFGLQDDGTPEALWNAVDPVTPTGLYAMFANGEFVMPDGTLNKALVRRVAPVNADNIIERLEDKAQDWTLDRRNQFQNCAYGEISLVMGMAQNLNTAPTKLQGGERLLLTSDASVPWQIDPKTMQLYTPIGRREEYKPALGVIPWAFPILQTSAHPAVTPEAPMPPHETIRHDHVRLGLPSTEGVGRVPGVLFSTDHCPHIVSKWGGFTQLTAFLPTDNRIHHWNLLDAETGEPVVCQTTHQLCDLTSV